MKNYLTLLFAILTLGLSAQTKEEIEHFQDLFGMEKVQVVTNLIEPAEEHRQLFWDLYDEYENARREQGLHRFEMIHNYIADYSTLNEENVGAMVKESMRLRDERDKLIRKFYERFAKQVSPVAAAQFYQIEHYFLSEINVALVEQLPIVGELKD